MLIELYWQRIRRLPCLNLDAFGVEKVRAMNGLVMNNEGAINRSAADRRSGQKGIFPCIKDSGCL